MITVGSTVEICCDVPYKEYGLKIGDVGVVTYVASTGKYAINFDGKQNPHADANNPKYGSPGYFWIPKKCVRLYNNFKQGDRVKIISQCSKYEGRYATVAYTKNDKVSLYVDNSIYQPGGGVVQLLTSSVSLVMNNESEGNKMSKLTGFKKVAVIELSGKDYFFALYEENVFAGTQVIVSCPMSSKFYTVKEVITVEEMRERFKDDITAEVISSVDTSMYDTRVENRKKAAELRREMDKKIAEMDEMNKYALYAERNSELAQMLAAYNSLVL